MDLKVGIILMKISGVLEWNTTNIYKKIASKLYILNLLCSQILVCSYFIYTYGSEIRKIEIFAKALWRTLGLLVTFISFGVYTAHSEDIKMLLNIPIDSFVTSKVEKKIWKTFKHVLLQKICIAVLISFVSLIRLYYSESSANLKVDDDNLYNATLYYKLLKFILNFLIFNIIVNIITVAFSIDLLAIYLIIAAYIYLKELQELIENLSFNIDMSQPYRQSSAVQLLKLQSDAKNCVTTHQLLAK
jgi:hypothetical protein